MQDIDPKMTDEELMRMYLQAHSSAFDELYRRHAGRLLAYFKKNVSVPVAEELLQDVFARMHSSRHTFKDNYPFLPWIFTVARHTLLDHMKKAETRLTQATNSTDTTEMIAAPEAVTVDTEQILASLSVDHRRIFEMRYLKEWSFEKIGKDTGLNTDNVRKIISRGLKKLQATGIKS